MEDKVYITRGGYERFVQRLKAIGAKYESVVATNESAADAGDNSVWHDNFSYEENQRDMHKWASTYKKLEKMQKKMVIVDIDPAPDEVKIGCAVKLYDFAKDTEATYSIVGYEDGDPQRNRLSYASPFAVSILNARVGDICSLKIGNQVKELKILKISPMGDD